MKKFRLYIVSLCAILAIVAYSNKKEEREAPAKNVPACIEKPAPLKNVSEQILVRKAYIVSYNKKTKDPNWVAWHLTAAHADGTCKRPSNAFHEDDDVPSPRATLGDYRKSGFTRGHMCPAGDNKWDQDAMYQSFLLSNMCPQDAGSNSGDWNEIEMACRQWAVKYGDVYIVCGPVFFKQSHQTIGANKVVVPEAFFKVVLRLGTHPQGIGFICRNEAGNHPKSYYVNTIDQVERITGIDFFPRLSDNIENAVEAHANINAW